MYSEYYDEGVLHVCLFFFVGTVVHLKKGRDGYPGAVYEVHYEDDVETSYIINHLIQDYEDGAVRML